ncbi:hypothetical protein CC1G_11056 [Coprinopsis cinerea okayama7|uniref:Uncharacterized protein n=1 Tax=Coprinopsis cinerea (strain Okayama-7 / 130 / ATCC MYA-4618 / FGSC 9003) TaxID=240176 RepID=A8NC87_COPC7|nr:hypothetical protein CC1G_11056 [Coprinopsis cinerea okayama7\|eukprot:XP_001832431.2 hypothetical protein CC1G_11056 [Coprinopsis cinerea okayama7\
MITVTVSATLGWRHWLQCHWGPVFYGSDNRPLHEVGTLEFLGVGTIKRPRSDPGVTPQSNIVSCKSITSKTSFVLKFVDIAAFLHPSERKAPRICAKFSQASLGAKLALFKVRVFRNMGNLHGLPATKLNSNHGRGRGLPVKSKTHQGKSETPRGLGDPHHAEQKSQTTRDGPAERGGREARWPPLSSPADYPLRMGVACLLGAGPVAHKQRRSNYGKGSGVLRPFFGEGRDSALTRCGLHQPTSQPTTPKKTNGQAAPSFKLKFQVTLSSRAPQLNPIPHLHPHHGAPSQ